MSLSLYRSPVTRVLLVAVLSGSLVSAQTKVTPPPNKFSPKQDVELGREAAVEAEKQMPVLQDDAVSSYVEDVGQRLVAVIPPSLHHDEFKYSFKVVNIKDINAFALPGGPMYVNRGMIESAQTEGEMAGVMAHELSHVMLRHGTAQATKAEKFQYGALAGAVLGAIIGGNVGSAVAQGTQFGLGTVFLRFSRDYEKQADLLGAQLMAEAGYDPRDLAHMFELIEKSNPNQPPQWLSDHPNPGNRVGYINDEAKHLTIKNPIGDSAAFSKVQAHLKALTPAPTMEELARKGGTAGNRPAGSGDGGRPGGNVAPPSSRTKSYREGNLFQITVPENWRELASSESVTFAPEGAYGQIDGRGVFTHGVEVGITRNERHGLREATEEFIDALGKSNPSLRARGRLTTETLARRSAMTIELTNTSDVTGAPESISLHTLLLRDGNLLYVVLVSPEAERGTYQTAFRRALQSLSISD